MELFVSPAGVVATIYDEALDLRTIGRQQIARASHVEPDDCGRWFAAIIDGPKLGPFDRRSAALAAEIEWLTAHWPLIPAAPRSAGAGHLHLGTNHTTVAVVCHMPTESSENRLVRAGQVVRLLQSYQDAGDEHLDFVAIDDESNGRVLVQIQVDLPIKPTQIVYSYMIDREGVGRTP